MKNDPAKVVIVLDFTKFGMVDEGNVHCFVVTLLSSGPDESVKSGISGHSKILLFLSELLENWKPATQYYDYVAQSSEKKPIKQVFPYVKV